jgi:hypothetical protein
MARVQCFANCGAGGRESGNMVACVTGAVHAGAEWVGVDVGDTGEGTNALNMSQQPSRKAGNGDFLGASLLSDAIRSTEGRTGLNITLSGAQAASDVVRQIHNALFRRTWKYPQFIVSSQDFACLTMVQCYDPNIRIGCMVLGAPSAAIQFAARMRAHCVFVEKTHVTSGLVEDCHRLDLEVIARVINSEEEFLLMEALEVDGVVSDFPDRIVAWRLPRYRGKRLAICE